MGIKLGSVILTILFLFVAKISFESSLDTGVTHRPTQESSGRLPASIDEGYAIHMHGDSTNHKRH